LEISEANQLHTDSISSPSYGYRLKLELRIWHSCTIGCLLPLGTGGYFHHLIGSYQKINLFSQHTLRQ